MIKQIAVLVGVTLAIQGTGQALIWFDLMNHDSLMILYLSMILAYLWIAESAKESQKEQS